ncbi:unnamed protein product [Bursaphelenchus xylophilus]|uniref:Innexin n=1 Tax=Bursaphelenchus xylophilus TaxID=6326 RepID=A0A1I7RL20_BURXY|nr:unnamed protein product [Bursaphelenchus xylophilus]CAG9083568.1 unnamed protein product [Bursaphelenchus xylophilus]
MDAKLRSLISKVKKEHDDDSVDRCIYATTVYILGFFAVLIMARQYVGEPLQCWVPAEYTGAWEQYIENYCFVENTYFVNRTIPDDKLSRRKLELKYYQWIPYLLSIQALICYAPKLIFKLLYSLSDLRVTDLVQVAYKECKEVVRPGIEKKIALQLLEKSQIKVQLHFNWYLTAIYLLMKILSIVALLGQLLMMNYFVAGNNFLWGYDVLSELVQGGDWRTTGAFPRVTFCDLRTRDLGQFREHTVQCVLMINMFAEKIYIFLWLWSLALLVVAILNLFAWLYRTLSMGSKVRMVKDALKLHHEKPSTANVEKFIQRFLKTDGMTVLRLIDSNAGYVNMADILCELWMNYGKKNDSSAPSPIPTKVAI